MPQSPIQNLNGLEKWHGKSQTKIPSRSVDPEGNFNLIGHA
jgi:hypothetical protein